MEILWGTLIILVALVLTAVAVGQVKQSLWGKKEDDIE